MFTWTRDKANRLCFVWSQNDVNDRSVVFCRYTLSLNFWRHFFWSVRDGTHDTFISKYVINYYVTGGKKNFYDDC